jgi:molybdopterin-guanine dinucleotide biosynthesis protein
MKDRKVKVIKKAAVKASTDKNTKQPTKARDAARDAVKTVSAWVSDFQSRKSEETYIAFEKLFAQTPRASES